VEYKKHLWVLSFASVSDFVRLGFISDSMKLQINKPFWSDNANVTNVVSELLQMIFEPHNNVVWSWSTA
jgi:hypothetical protein